MSCSSDQDCKEHIIYFAGEYWVFPSTISQVDQKHRFSFYPPAYYHKKKWDNSQLIILSADWQSGDFDNERQDKEDLFDRQVNTYIFQIRKTKFTYDSLKNVIEANYQKKFELVKGTKTKSEYSSEPPIPFEHYLLRVDSCLTVGIKNGSSDELGDIVTVHFMYGMTLGDIGVEVGNY